MGNKFSELGVLPKIVKAVEDMGFVEATEVQSRAIPFILDKKDLIVMSKTGSGKTGAFGIPMIQQISKEEQGKEPQGLILTPTRELVVQVDSDLKKMAKYIGVKTTPVYGQHNIGVEIEKLEKGVAIVTGTPGRVLDHIQRKTLITKNIKFLVLDEADRMLDMGFIDQVVKIIKALPRNRVTLLFSATMPAEIQRICKAYMNQPVTIELESDTKTVDTIKQIYYRVEPNEKRTQLNRILKVEQPDSCIVFCNTRIAVDKVQQFLQRKGYVSASLHGANSQSSRMNAIQKFKNGQLQIIVATDVAARGLHIDNLNLVINYDVPVENDSYVHRIGRTGRAGNSGKSITLVTGEDIWTFYEIEEHVGVLISEEDLPTDEFVRKCVAKANGKWAKAKVKPAKTGTSKPVQSTNKTTSRAHKPYEKNRTNAKPDKTSETKQSDSRSSKQNVPHNAGSRSTRPNETNRLRSKPSQPINEKKEIEKVITPAVVPEKKKSFFKRLGEWVKKK